MPCPRAFRALRSAMAETGGKPQLKGQEVTLDAALEAGADLFRNATRPLFAGSATDVSGSRAVLLLAQATGGVIDHMHGNAMQRNLEVLQGSGWMSTNFGELQNRADLVVVLDSDVLTRYPRLTERFLTNTEKTLVTVGGEPESEHEHVAVPLTTLADVLGALRCLVANAPLPPNIAVDVPALEQLAQRMTRARYGVLLWSAQSFEFEHGDLVIQAAADLVSELNQYTRFTCLPLAAGDGAATLQQVSTWNCGFPLRVGFNTGAPVYDPYHHATDRLLSRNETDLMVWLASFEDDHAPPPTGSPRIVLGRPGNEASANAEVFIPVGIPGIDQAGHQFRSDGVAALTLKEQRDIALPSAASVLHELLRRLHTDNATDTPC